MSERNVFTGNPLDRGSNERHDPEWVKAQVDSPEARYLAYSKLSPAVRMAEAPSLVWLGREVLEHLPESVVPLLLGVSDGVPHFAVDVTEIDEVLAVLGLTGVEFAETRGIALRLPFEEAGIVSQGRSLLDWHKRYGFCSNCGSATTIREGGASRECGNCGAHHFPRTDCSVIMVVWRDDRILLGRRPNAPSHRYSCLAGYIDQGETIEEAVRREVREEAGIEVDEVTYYSSQPWPFPSQLMIGCFAHATTEEINIDPHEIEEAHWFTRDEVRGAFAGGGELRIPDRIAIAHQIIKAWVDGEAP